jgi:hypothetical protein
MDFGVAVMAGGTHVATSIPSEDSRIGLIGVPGKSEPGLRWKPFSGPAGISADRLPESLRSDGMVCPRCGNEQLFADQCVYCLCVFSGFVIIEAEPLGGKKLGPKAAVPGPKRKKARALLRASIDTSSLRFRAMATAAVILLAGALYLGNEQYKTYLQGQYSRNYVLALYGIKSGMERLDRVYLDESSALEKASASAVSHTMEAQELADLKTVKDEVDRIMKKMGAAPAECYQSDLNIRKLHFLYDKTNSLMIEAPDALLQNKNEILAVNNDFAVAYNNLKSSLPEPLTKELSTTGRRYQLDFVGLAK